MARRPVELSDDDRIIWAKVARTAKPLKGKAGIPPEPEAARFADLLDEEPTPTGKPGTVTPAPAEPPVRKERTATHFDVQVRDKLHKGRLPIDARVDLHGMTQAEAHGLLLSFLYRAHAGGLRYVLVITGKGASFGSDGALKRAVPAWLATPTFRPLVSGHDHAARKHGGGGAIYVRLRKKG